MGKKDIATELKNKKMWILLSVVSVLAISGVVLIYFSPMGGSGELVNIYHLAGGTYRLTFSGFGTLYTDSLEYTTDWGTFTFSLDERLLYDFTFYPYNSRLNNVDCVWQIEIPSPSPSPPKTEMWFAVRAEYENGEPAKNAIVYFSNQVPEENKSWMAWAESHTDNEGKTLTSTLWSGDIIAVAIDYPLWGWSEISSIFRPHYLTYLNDDGEWVEVHPQINWENVPVVVLDKIWTW